MENDILQEPIQQGKSYLPSPFPAHKIVIKKKSLQSIMITKGWKTYNDVGTALNFTRQYVTMIANGTPVSSEFIVRLAMAIGNTTNNWFIHYDIVPRGYIHSNHPTWNQQKHDGQIPYEKYSLMADLRKRDYDVEKQEYFRWYKK
jgi:hypothetical protein